MAKSNIAHSEAPQADEAFEIVRFDEIHDAPVEEAAGSDLPRLVQGPIFQEPKRSDRPSLLRSAAGAALRALAGAGAGIEMIDVIQVMGHRRRALQRWRCRHAAGESAAEYHRRSLELAQDFLASCPDPGDGSVVYSLFTTGGVGLDRAA